MGNNRREHSRNFHAAQMTQNTRRSNIEYAQKMIGEINRVSASKMISPDFADSQIRQYRAIISQNSTHASTFAR